jgi:hypothetical protein
VSPHPPLARPEPEEYLPVNALAARIGYAPKTLRNLMSAGVLLKGRHWVKPRGRVLFVWSAVEAWLREGPGPRRV